MHIIRISPQSFKIILSKEDLGEYGDNPLGSAEDARDFFEDIIQKTNLLYGEPFSKGGIDARFFESKDGGGELFLTAKQKEKVYYIFSTDNTEVLINLCKSLSFRKITCDSTLYGFEKEYRLFLTFDRFDPLIIPIVGEFGAIEKATDFDRWILEEHANIILQNGAVEKIASAFT